MPLDYKTLPAKWKSVKPLTMGKTGVGEALTVLVQYDAKKITKVAEAKFWLPQFDKTLRALDTAREKPPIKTDAKTKKWLDATISEMLQSSSLLGRIASGILLYDSDEKKWVPASEQQTIDHENLQKLMKAWRGLKPETRQKIMTLVKGG